MSISIQWNLAGLKIVFLLLLTIKYCLQNISKEENVNSNKKFKKDNNVSDLLSKNNLQLTILCNLLVLCLKLINCI